jgi:serine/threonine protein kinase
MILVSDPVNVLEGTAPHAVPKQSSTALLDRYIPIQAAGVGSTASVMLAYDSVTHKNVALKAVRKSKMSKRKILQEIRVQAAVSQHPFIATLHDAVETADTFTLVEEYMPNGDLFDVIKPDLGMPEAQV